MYLKKNKSTRNHGKSVFYIILGSLTTRNQKIINSTIQKFLKFCMVYAYVKALVVPSFKYPNFWPHFKRNLFLEKLEKIASRTRKGKKPNKTVDQAQFHRGLLLLILEGDSSVNYTSDDGIAVSKFHTLKSSVNWVITPRLLALYCEVK